MDPANLSDQPHVATVAARSRAISRTAYAACCFHAVTRPLLVDARRSRMLWCTSRLILPVLLAALILNSCASRQGAQPVHHEDRSPEAGEIKAMTRMVRGWGAAAPHMDQAAANMDQAAVDLERAAAHLGRAVATLYQLGLRLLSHCVHPQLRAGADEIEVQSDRIRSLAADARRSADLLGSPRALALAPADMRTVAATFRNSATDIPRRTAEAREMLQQVLAAATDLPAAAARDMERGVDDAESAVDDLESAAGNFGAVADEMDRAAAAWEAAQSPVETTRG